MRTQPIPVTNGTDVYFYDNPPTPPPPPSRPTRSRRRPRRARATWSPSLGSGSRWRGSKPGRAASSPNPSTLSPPVSEERNTGLSGQTLVSFTFPFGDWLVLVLYCSLFYCVGIFTIVVSLFVCFQSYIIIILMVNHSEMFYNATNSGREGAIQMMMMIMMMVMMMMMMMMMMMATILYYYFRCRTSLDFFLHGNSVVLISTCSPGQGKEVGPLVKAKSQSAASTSAGTSSNVDPAQSLPSFWIPSLTPEAKPTLLKKPVRETTVTCSYNMFTSRLGNLGMENVSKAVY